jgi:thymidylate kinase
MPMAIGQCRLVAIEGTNGVGKTTVAHALTAFLKSQGILAEYCDESARVNAFVEDFTVHHQPLSMHIELQLFSAAISSQILATRRNDIVICDKSPTSLIGYSRVLLPDKIVGEDAGLFEAMRLLLWEWSEAYDAVFFLSDDFTRGDERDQIRQSVTKVKWQVSDFIHSELDNFRCEVIDVPTGMPLEERVTWLAEQLMLRQVVDLHP